MKKKKAVLPAVLFVLLLAAALGVTAVRAYVIKSQAETAEAPAETPAAAEIVQETSPAPEEEPEEVEPEDPRPQLLWDTAAEESADGLDELNAEIGSKLARPDCFRVENEEYALITCRDYEVAEYSFDFDGQRFTVRAAATRDDISGIYDGEPLFAEGSSDLILTDSLKAARWFYHGIQYCLLTEDGGEFEEEFFRTLTDDLNGLSF